MPEPALLLASTTLSVGINLQRLWGFFDALVAWLAFAVTSPHPPMPTPRFLGWPCCDSFWKPWHTLIWIHLSLGPPCTEAYRVFVPMFLKGSTSGLADVAAGQHTTPHAVQLKPGYWTPAWKHT